MRWISHEIALQAAKESESEGGFTGRAAWWFFVDGVVQAALNAYALYTGTRADTNLMTTEDKLTT